MQFFVSKTKDSPTRFNFSIVSRQEYENMSRFQLAPAVANDCFLIRVAKTENLKAVVIDAAKSNWDRLFF